MSNKQLFYDKSAGSTLVSVAIVTLTSLAVSPSVGRGDDKLTAEHKPAGKVVVAIARELAGFLWAALQPEPTGAD